MFNLLEQLVARGHGEDTWDALLNAGGLDGVYTSLGSYPDEDLGKLVSAAADALDVRPTGCSGLDATRCRCLPALPPALRAAHARSFVLTLNEIIHPEVRKLYPGADVPEFDFDVGEGMLSMGYRSARKLCSFAEGLLTGAADHYRERVTIEQPSCMKRGDDRCVVEIVFAP